MENTNNGNVAYNGADQNNERQEQNRNHQQSDELNAEETASLLTDDADYADYAEPLYATGGGEDEDEENEEDGDNDDSEDDDEADNDWGNVDPLEDNSPFPSSNDPSGPGSAV